MSATKRLRELLDERGVEWDNYIRPFPQTAFNVNGVVWQVKELVTGLDVSTRYLTPEQAIAATLGRGTCHDLAETPAYRDKTEFKCSECGYEYSAVGGFGCDCGDEPDFNYCPNCGRRVEVGE